jgi:hypothetical protein
MFYVPEGVEQHGNCQLLKELVLLEESFEINSRKLSLSSPFLPRFFTRQKDMAVIITLPA